MNSSAILTLLLTAGATGAFAQNGIGAKFGARDPRTCKSKKEPAKGAPTADQLKEYFICEAEKADGYSGTAQLLYLVTNVTLEVAKGRPFNMRTDSWPDIDPSQMVYPVRGSFTWWQCSVLGSIGGDPGKNCTKTEQPHASGMCFKTTFSDWHCPMSDIYNNGTTMERFPPPAGK